LAELAADQIAADWLVEQAKVAEVGLYKLNAVDP
jgi:hypothetical protein